MKKKTLFGFIEGIGIFLVGVGIATAFLSGFTFHQDFLLNVSVWEFFGGAFIGAFANEEKKTYRDCDYIFTGEKKKRRKSRKEIKADEQKKNRDAVYAFFVANELDSGNR